jgi:hypothetical protein
MAVMKSSVGGDGGFHCVLLYDIVSDYLQVSDSGLIEAVSRNFIGGSEENNDKCQA